MINLRFEKNFKNREKIQIHQSLITKNTVPNVSVMMTVTVTGHVLCQFALHMVLIILVTRGSCQTQNPPPLAVFKWKGGVSSCVRRTCSLDRSYPANDYWSWQTTCTGPDGTDYGRYVRSQEYPLGTVCSDKCKEHEMYEPQYSPTDESTCVCVVTGLIPFILHKLFSSIDNLIHLL